MDYSKLPRLSNTPTPPPGGPAHPDDPRAGRPTVPDYADEPPGGGPSLGAFDVFLSVVMGLLFLFLGLNYGRYLSAKWAGKVYDTHTTWMAPHPKAGQPVGYWELEGYPALSESALFLFGVTLLVDAGARLVPRSRRRLKAGLVAAALVLTVLVTGYNAYAFVTLFRAGFTPLLSFLAFAFGGYVAFTQYALLRTVLGPARPARAESIDRAEQLVASAVGGGAIGAGRARCAHYKFAHQALRLAAFENPGRCVGLLQGPGAGKFLRELWDAVRADCGPAAAPGDDAPDGLEADLTQIGPYTGAIVTLPPARFKGEAYFVGIVLRSFTRADGSVVERDPLTLYYTLEHGPGPDGSAGTALCRWVAGDHVRYPETPPPDAAAFRQAMVEKVNELQKREDGGQ